MNKEEFLEYLGEKDTSAIAAYKKLSLAKQCSYEIFTNEFYTPNIWSKIKKMSSKFSINVETWGGFEEAERRIIGFNLEDKSHYPISIIEIVNKSKFILLEHKDYLGAIMSLGIKRNKLGDLVVNENRCFAAVFQDIADYICMNLSSIGKCPCEVVVVNDFYSLPAAKFEKLVTIVSSVRLDCVIAGLCNLSRSKAEQVIKSGKVLLDYSEALEKNKEVSFGNVITIRGYGKYKVGEILGNTAKGRIKIEIKKYI